MRRGNNKNNPAKGSTIKVEPIRDRGSINNIKERLRAAGKPRDLCLFTVGINTAFRASELLSLTVGQVAGLKPGDRLEIFQTKTRRHRAITVNRAFAASVADWLQEHPKPNEELPLFISARGVEALKVSVVNRMVMAWCASEGLRGNFGSHTMRKTWGYHQLRCASAPLPVLMEAYGHSTQRQTLDYLCIEADEVSALYTGLEL